MSAVGAIARTESAPMSVQLLVTVEASQLDDAPWVVHSPSVPINGTVPVSTLMPGMTPFDLSISIIVCPLLAFNQSIFSRRH